MKNRWKRLVSATLALVLAGSLALPGLAAELAETPSGSDNSSAQPLAVTVGTYTPKKGQVIGDVDAIQAGQTYTLIALPASIAANGSTPRVLTPTELLAANSQALFIGSATASAAGQVTFERVRLRTAEAAVYYVTGPGLTTPLAEATGLSTSAAGSIRTASTDRAARISLVDAETGYHYSNYQTSDAVDGYYYFDQLSPGSYDLQVAKPGYLPTTHKNVTIQDGGTTTIRTLDISENVGDVTNDGLRDLTDLAALLLYYDKPASTARSGLTPDLSSDGQVGKADVDLLLPYLTTGAAAQVQDASISVSDAGNDPSASSRSLTFSITSSAPVSAAAFSITYHADAIQPLNEKGGLVSPVDGGGLANCLAPAPGYTARLTNWKVSGNLVTLSFGLTADTPQSAGTLAQFYYRPAGGSTGDLYPGVFVLDQAAALVGRDTVVTDATLTHPNSDSTAITSLTIDQQPASGQALTQSIPTLGQTTVMALSATGSNAQETFPNLPGVTWNISRPGGGSVDGIAVKSGMLTITSQAAAGQISITASLGDVTSQPLLVTLQKDASIPYSITILKNGQACAQDTASFDFEQVAAPYSQYDARILDQYGAELTGQSITWTLSRAPAGVSIDSTGRLTASKTATPTGSHSFTIRAQCGGAQAILNMELSVRIPLKALSISGAKSATIPSQPDQSLTLNYTISAINAQDQSMSADDLSLSLTVSPANRGVEATYGLTGTFVIVSSTAQPGTYTLTARANSGSSTVSTTFDLELKADATQAARAILYYNGQSADSLVLSCQAGKSGAATFIPQFLNTEGKPIENQPGTWSWLLTPTTPGLSISAQGVLSIASTMKAGRYPLELTATENTTGLSVKAPITLVITPVLGSLTLTAPDSLTLPVGETLTHTLALDAADAHAQPMEPPAGLKWSVTAKGSSTAPIGVTVSDGVLTVAPTAKAGVITVTVSDDAGNVKSSVDITLTAATTSSVLTLYRTITLDGKTSDKLPVSGGLDAVDLKEGSAVTFTYTASLVNQSTGTVEDVTDQVTWLGNRREYTIGAETETGVYSSIITAVYNGQSVSVTAQASVYPHITDLRLYFGDGTPTTLAEVEPPYTLTIPNNTAKIYSAKLMALIQRDGNQQLVPLSDLGLSDYKLTVSCVLNGVTTAVNKTTHTLQVTVTPSAIQNSMDEPQSGAVDTRFIALSLEYYPGESLNTERFPFRLVKNNAELKQAILRRGVNSGTALAFDTAKSPESVSLPAGAFTNYYALELLDQYNLPVVNREVTWRLVGAPKDAQGNFLISIFNPGDTLSGLYTNYASIRSLAIHPDTPAGVYDLTLSASAADFTCTQNIRLTVGSAADAKSLISTIIGAQSILIPRYYLQRNSTTLNKDEVNTATFLALLHSSDGDYDLYPLGWQFDWKVVSEKGKAVEGVKITPNKNPSEATVSVNYLAKLPEFEDRYWITFTATSPSGEQTQGATPLTLTRESAIPYLLDIRKGGVRITSDSFTLSSNQSGQTQTYVCYLQDQYGSLLNRSVSWSLTGGLSSVISMKTVTVGGHSAAEVSVKNPGINTTTTSTLTVALAGQELSASINISVKTSASNDGGGGGGGGGDVVAPSPTPSVKPSPSPSPSPTPSVAPPPVASAPANITLSPPMTQSGSSGSAALTASQEKLLNDTSASGGTVTIAPSGGTNLTSASVTLTSATAADIATRNKQSLQVQTPLGTVLLSPESLKALAARGGANTVITLSNNNGVLKVDFTCGSVAGSLPGSVALSAPSSGNIAVRINQDGTETLLKKAVVSNNRILTYLTGSTQLRLESRAPTFADTQSHWAKESISFTAARELFQGTSASTFSPDSTMTRSMLVTVLHRLEDTPAATATATFADVPQGSWYTSAVSWANSSSIVQGTDAGFKPDDPVTREQLATILYRYMNSLHLSTSGRNNLYAFSDRDRVSPWAREAMEWAVASGLIRGKSDGILDPTGNATRAEVSTIMERLIRSMAPTV